MSLQIEFVEYIQVIILQVAYEGKMKVYVCVCVCVLWGGGGGGSIMKREHGVAERPSETGGGLREL